MPDQKLHPISARGYKFVPSTTDPKKSQIVDTTDLEEAAGIAINTLDRNIAEEVRNQVIEKNPSWIGSSIRLSTSRKSYVLVKGFMGNMTFNVTVQK